MKKNDIKERKINKKTDKQILKRKIEKEIKKQDNEKEIKKLKNKKQINFKKLNKKNIKDLEPIGNLSRKKRMKWEMFIALILLIGLVIRLCYIQFLQGEELKSMAYVQQTLDRNINPKRGTIYDSTRKNYIGS